MPTQNKVDKESKKKFKQVYRGWELNNWEEPNESFKIDVEIAKM